MAIPIKKHLRHWGRSLRHQISRKQAGGTIITGCVRSGTTLALRVYCPDLQPEEERDGSVFNEPQPFSDYITQGSRRKALLDLPAVLDNRHRLIKSPQIAFLLPQVPPRYTVIAIFRDLRLIVPSMLQHKNVQDEDLTDSPYWAAYAGITPPDDPFLKATLAAEQYYRHILEYRGELQIWNYGFWDEWVVQNDTIHTLYSRENETSAGVMTDVRTGKLFSNQSFSKQRWDEFCQTAHVTAQQQNAVETANQRLVDLYRNRGLRLLTLDDVNSQSTHG